MAVQFQLLSVRCQDNVERCRGRGHCQGRPRLVKVCGRIAGNGWGLRDRYNRHTYPRATLETIQGSASGCHNVHQGSAGSAPSCTNSVLTHAKQSSVAADHNVHLLHKLQASMMQDLMASPYASLHETVMPHNVPGRTPSQPDRR